MSQIMSKMFHLLWLYFVRSVSFNKPLHYFGPCVTFHPLPSVSDSTHLRSSSAGLFGLVRRDIHFDNLNSFY